MQTKIRPMQTNIIPNNGEKKRFVYHLPIIEKSNE
jgi:hypothetical protein